MFGKLKRVSAGTYLDAAGNIFRLVTVDRNFNCRRPPKYYLQRIRDGKAEYISGVFETKRPGVFSADVKDSLGVKTFLEIQANDSGEELEIIARTRPVK